MTCPLVSVVIPAYNAADTISETLSALQSQTGTTPFETIVVDNASTDATAEIARRFGVTVLKETKRGPSAARNCGLRAARGEVILHCDADTVPSRRWVSEMAGAFENPAVVLVAGNTQCYPPKTPAERFERSRLLDMQRALDRPVLPFVVSFNLGVRRAAALAVGGFCEELRTAEDVDFSQRLLGAFESTICYRERAVLYHHGRADAKTLKRQAHLYGVGMAECYLRYPDLVAWSWRQSVLVGSRLVERRCEMIFCMLRATVGAESRERLEFLRYRNLWDTQFFTGFFRRYYAGRRVAQ